VHPASITATKEGEPYKFVIKENRGESISALEMRLESAGRSIWESVAAEKEERVRTYVELTRLKGRGNIRRKAVATLGGHDTVYQDLHPFTGPQAVCADMARGAVGSDWANDKKTQPAWRGDVRVPENFPKDSSIGQSETT